ncbi:MAG TPA: hypothetical protein EYG16_04200 [Deltaproteobacteria bacterium]|nr:hypothetical protein [Candidatus Binatota bacterium]HIL12855.1 hypothetical protein [Deltaproteobacteria bacterium]
MEASRLNPVLRRLQALSVALTIAVLVGVLVVEKATAQVCTSEDNLLSSVDAGVAPVLTDVWSDEDGLPSDAAKVFDMDSGTFWNSDWFGANSEPLEGYGDHSYLIAEFSSPEVINQFVIEQDATTSEALDIYVTTDASAASSSLTGWTQVASLTGLGAGTEVVDISAVTVLKTKLVFPSGGNTGDARILEFAARLCGCSSDPDCDDSLACNGVETCDLGSGNCVVGTPPCTAPCDASCTEPAGTCVPEPDATGCDSGSDTCSELDECLGGVCVNTGGGSDTDGDGICDTDDLDTTPGSFVIKSVVLRPARASKSNGLARITSSFISENDTGGGLVDTMLAGNAFVTVSDQGGFSSTISLTGCASSANGARVMCRSVDKLVRAVLKPLRGIGVPLNGGASLFVSKFRLRAKGLDAASTGVVVPTGPADVGLFANPVARRDSVSLCQPRGPRKLFCTKN